MGGCGSCGPYGARGEIAQETPWVDLEALVLHKSGCVWFKKGDIQRTLNKN